MLTIESFLHVAMSVESFLHVVLRIETEATTPRLAVLIPLLYALRISVKYICFTDSLHIYSFQHLKFQA